MKTTRKDNKNLMLNQMEQDVLRGTVAAGVCHPLYSLWNTENHPHSAK